MSYRVQELFDPESFYRRWISYGWLLTLSKRKDTITYGVCVDNESRYILIPAAKTGWDVFRNTMAYQLIRRKQKSGEWTGHIVLEQLDGRLVRK